jgi:hypothetical protein
VRTFRFRGALPALVLCLAALAPGVRREAHCAVAAGSLAVSVSLEPAEIRVGDPARLTVTVDHPAAGSIALPEIERGKTIVVSDRKRETVAITSGEQAGRERTTFVVTLTSFELGRHRLGTGKIGFTDRVGGALEVPFPDTALQTNSVLTGGDVPMRGTKDLVRWPAPLRRWFGLAAGLLLLAAAVVLAARRLRGGRRDKPAPGPPAVSPPHERALKALAALRGRSLVQQPAVEPLYRELSSIVRRYIEERFGLRATGRTTEEFIREAAGSGLLSAAHQELVRAFLEQCDLVKFARHRPPSDDLALVFAAAERLVRETKRVAGP